MSRHLLILLFFAFQISLSQCTRMRYGNDNYETSVYEVHESFATVISKLYEEVGNFSSNTYKKSSERANSVLKNNTNEIQRNLELVNQLHREVNKVLSESGMSYYPQLIKDCKEKVDQDKENLELRIAEAENMCVLFITDVFQLVDNPPLYKNISDTYANITRMKEVCGKSNRIQEARDCYTVRSQNLMKRTAELRKEIGNFLLELDAKVNDMKKTLHTCYLSMRQEVLIGHVRGSVRHFKRCVDNKNRH